MSKRNAAIYRMAAQLIDEGKNCYACIAVETAGDTYDLVNEFARWFRPDSWPVLWWGSCEHDDRLRGPEHQKQRILGLLFMAAIEESAK